jgi:hypothetical protein
MALFEAKARRWTAGSTGVSARLVTALLLALVLVCAGHTLQVALALEGYNYRHGWVSAHFAVMARSFVSHGIFGLGGVPIQNEGPLTASPDAYVNWPPLYPMLLSLVFRVAGDAETVQHVVAALLVLAPAAVVAALVRWALGTIPAAIAAIAYLTAPIVAAFGHLGLHLHLAILLSVAALACFAVATRPVLPGAAPRRRLWAVGATIAILLAAFTSWEATLAAPGLVLLAVLRRDRPALRLAVLLAVFAAAGAVSVFVLYAIEYRWFGDAILHRILLRTGFGTPSDVSSLVSPHSVQEAAESTAVSSLPTYLLGVVIGRLALLGIIGLPAVAAAIFIPRRIWRGQSALAYVAAGLASMFLLWAALMRNHLEIHDYEVLLLAPLAALCAGAASAWLLGRGGEGVLRRSTVALVAVLVLVALAGRIAYTTHLLAANAVADPQIQFARAVRDAVEPDAIVTHPSRSMIPLYYMRRHTIRSIDSQAVLDDQREAILALCRACPVYVAVPETAAGSFPALAQEKPVARFDHLGAVYRMGPAAGAGAGDVRP